MTVNLKIIVRKVLILLKISLGIYSGMKNSHVVSQTVLETTFLNGGNQCFSGNFEFFLILMLSTS